MSLDIYNGYSFDRSHLNNYDEDNCDNYYFKPFYLQELIGSTIAKNISLETVNYKLFKNCPFDSKQKSSDIMLASLDFKKENNFYFNIFSFIEINCPELYDTMYLENHLSHYLNQCVDKENRKIFINKFLKLVALDTYMRQKDRCRVNITLCRNKQTNFFDFSPIYDYEKSLLTEDVSKEFFYRNPIWPLNLYTYPIFCDEYPDFKDELTNLQKLDLMALIDEIASKYHFTMTSEIEDYYKKQEEISQLLLQKILN